MIYPIIELITQDVEKTIRNVQTSAGYSEDLIVERELQFGNRMRDKLAVVTQQDTERLDQASVPEQRMAYRQQYWIYLYVVESETSTRPIDQRINMVRSDVEKAIMLDHTRGGLAVDTLIRDPISIVDDQGRWDGVIVVFDVHYRTIHSDPYTRG